MGKRKKMSGPEQNETIDRALAIYETAITAAVTIFRTPGMSIDEKRRRIQRITRPLGKRANALMNSLPPD